MAPKPKLIQVFLAFVSPLLSFFVFDLFILGRPPHLGQGDAVQGSYAFGLNFFTDDPAYHFHAPGYLIALISGQILKLTGLPDPSLKPFCYAGIAIHIFMVILCGAWVARISSRISIRLQSITLISIVTATMPSMMAYAASFTIYYIPGLLAVPISFGLYAYAVEQEPRWRFLLAPFFTLGVLSSIHFGSLILLASSLGALWISEIFGKPRHSWLSPITSTIASLISWAAGWAIGNNIFIKVWRENLERAWQSKGGPRNDSPITLLWIWDFIVHLPWHGVLPISLAIALLALIRGRLGRGSLFVASFVILELFINVWKIGVLPNPWPGDMRIGLVPRYYIWTLGVVALAIAYADTRYRLRNWISLGIFLLSALSLGQYVAMMVPAVRADKELNQTIDQFMITDPQTKIVCVRSGVPEPCGTLYAEYQHGYRTGESFNKIHRRILGNFVYSTSNFFSCLDNADQFLSCLGIADLKPPLLIAFEHAGTFTPPQWLEIVWESRHLEHILVKFSPRPQAAQAYR